MRGGCGSSCEELSAPQTENSCSSASGGGSCQGSDCDNGGCSKPKNSKTRLRNSTYEETKRAALEATIPGAPPRCYRCPGVGTCNPRGGEVLCWECLGTQLIRNFRNQMTRARASAPSERMLVAFSGGTRSTALAHMLRCSVADLRGRQFEVQLAFVDDLDIFLSHGLDTTTKREFVSCVETLGANFGFDFAVLTLPENARSELATGLADIASKSSSVTNSVTKWEDARARLRMNVLLGYAEEHACTRVILGDSASSIAARVVSDATKGQPLNSPHLALQEHVHARRHVKSVLRPLSDMLDEELFLLVRRQGLVPASTPLSLVSNSSPWLGASLNAHATRLIAVLQADKKGSVHTILRTISKLEEATAGACAHIARDVLATGNNTGCNTDTDTEAAAAADAADAAAAAAAGAAAVAEGLAAAIGGTLVGNDFMAVLARAAAAAAAAARAEEEKENREKEKEKEKDTKQEIRLGAQEHAGKGGGEEDDAAAAAAAAAAAVVAAAAAVAEGAHAPTCSSSTASKEGAHAASGRSSIASTRRTSSMCDACGKERAAVKRSKTGAKVCKECFYALFEQEIHDTIVNEKMFKRGEKVCVAASGGKDSTVLAHVMTRLNAQHDYGLELQLLSIDEGIAGYRDDSLETVKRNQAQYSLPLTILSYRDLYGWSMDEIVRHVGRKGNCTFCGVFRRQALDRGATQICADKIVTGHNADDMAETVLLNILRGDVPRLQRCTQATTGVDGALPRSKPFKHAYEKEIVMYAHFKKLDYFSTECIYSPNAYRGFAREFIKDVERVDANSVLRIILSGESVQALSTFKMPTQGSCSRCGYISSQQLCKACVLLQDLARRKAELEQPPRGAIRYD